MQAWKFGAKTEVMSAEQRRLFEETRVEDEASLQAQLEHAEGKASTPPVVEGDRKCKPLPHHLYRVEQHAPIGMSLVKSAKLNGHDPPVYFNNVLTRLHMHLNSRINKLLPHNWQPTH